MDGTTFQFTRIATAVGLMIASLTTVAAEYEIADGKLDVHGSVSAGSIIRTDSRDPSLMPAVNATLVGANGTAPGGKTQDDGNLNFGRNNAVSTTLKGYLDVKYSQGDYGVVGRAKAWHDFALENGSRPWGNTPNGFVAGQPLSDSGFVRRAAFSGVDVDGLYGFGHNSLGGGAVDWKVGLQKLEWGNRFTISGGLGDLSPRDLPAANRAGALPEELRIPVPALSAQFAINPSTKVDAFLQAGFRPNVANGCGTFYSATDFIADGCDKAMIGTASDRTSLATGQFIKRSGNDMPSGGGQLGVGIRQNLASLDADVGAYIAQYHSRAAYFSAIKGQRTGAPFVPNDPGGLNTKYFIDYPEDVRVLGLTFEKKLPAGAVIAELTYRPNQPYQYNAVDLLNAFASAAGPTPLRAAATATASGAVFQGYERHKAVQLNVGAAHALPGILGATSANVGAELAFKNVPDLPDQRVTRFRRSDVFGQAPVGAAACPATAGAQTCSLNGYVSANSWAYRLRAGLRYAEIANGVDFIPSLSFGHDVHGWSEDGAISEGRKFAVVSLKAEWRKSYVVELAWMPTWGGDYNNLRDRSAAALNLGYRF